MIPFILLCVLRSETTARWDIVHISETAALEIQARGGQWIAADERKIPVRREPAGDLTVRVSWSGYRGTFTADVTIDTARRVRAFKWIRQDGRLFRSGPWRVIRELGDTTFLSQFIGRNLEDFARTSSVLHSPPRLGIRGEEYLQITTALIVEALVVACGESHSFQSSPGMIRCMNSSNMGTVNAVSP